MNDPFLIARRDAARLLLAPFAALAVSHSGDAEPIDTQETATAAKVKSKVDRAKTKSQQHREEEEREAFADFRKEISKYEALHNKELAKLGGPADDPGRQKALASAIAGKRGGVKQGEIFSLDLQTALRQRINEQMTGPDAVSARKAAAEGNPGHEEDSIKVDVKVNGAYPTGAARSTVPPSVLLVLPPLPDCLNYRFVGRDLLIVDSVAGLIVDFLPQATPALPVS